MSKKHKQVHTTLNYIENLLILGSPVTGFVLTSAFTSLVGTPIGNTSSAVGSNLFAITSGIKKYNSKIKKKKKKHDKIVLLAKKLVKSYRSLNF